MKASTYPLHGNELGKWWRRGELNPRPKPRHLNIYVRVPLFSLAVRKDSGQTLRTAQQPRKYKRTTRLPGCQHDLLSSFLPA